MSTESEAIVFPDDARSLEFEAKKFETATGHDPVRAAVVDIALDVLAGGEDDPPWNRFLRLPVVEQQALMLEINAAADVTGHIENDEDLEQAVHDYYRSKAHLGEGGSARVERFARSAQARLVVPPPTAPIAGVDVPLGEDERRCIDLADAWAQERSVSLLKIGARDHTHAREDLCLFLRRQQVKQRVIGWLLGHHITGGKPSTDEYVRQLTRRAEARAESVGGEAA